MRKLIYNASGGIERAFHCEDPNDITSIVGFTATQDVEPLLRHIRTLRDGKLAGPNGRHVAEVPRVIYDQWVREGKANDPAFIKAWVNDPENRAFRVHGGNAF